MPAQPRDGLGGPRVSETTDVIDWAATGLPLSGSDLAGTFPFSPWLALRPYLIPPIIPTLRSPRLLVVLTVVLVVFLVVFHVLLTVSNVPPTSPMALVAPAHRIQTIHGVFGSPSWSSILPASGASQSLEMSSFNSLPNTSLTSLRGRGNVNLSLLAARSAMPSAPSPQTPVVTRPRRSSIHGVSTPVTTRRPPPPPPVQRATIIPVIEDPFADRPFDQDYVVETPPSPRAQTRTTQPFARTQLATTSRSSYVYPTVTPRRDTERTSRLVASVLLSRASGRPMRRRFPSMEEKSYVPSGLSRMVMVEC